MFLLLKVWPLDEWIDEWAEFALVEVSPGFAGLVLQRMDQAETTRQMDSSFTCAEYWDGAPQWLRYDEAMEELLGQGEIAVLSEKPQVTEDQLIRQDGTRMCVEIAGREPPEVRWRSFIKHTDVQMHTAAVPRQVFEEAVGRSDRQKSQKAHQYLEELKDKLRGIMEEAWPDNVFRLLAEALVIAASWSEEERCFFQRWYVLRSHLGEEGLQEVREMISPDELGTVLTYVFSDNPAVRIQCEFQAAVLGEGLVDLEAIQQELTQRGLVLEDFAELALQKKARGTEAPKLVVCPGCQGKMWIGSPESGASEAILCPTCGGTGRVVEFFTAIRLSREDVAHATGRECADLPDHVMQKIAERVGDGLFEGGAWEVIAEATELCLEEELC